MRLDLLLKSLCLVKQRSQAKSLCDSGSILVNGKPGKASKMIDVGDELRIDFPSKRLTIRIREVPGTKNVAKAQAMEFYEVLAQERLSEELP